ncbi:MAG TPA: glycine--tRNA ligase subunit beta [Arcobacter sp.]|nr:glycine--tRNA ligase subunit beta [Arcobacter sp.]
MIKPLLIEIAVEELPAIPFLNELPNIERKWSKILEDNNLLCEFNFYYTPRRLVFWHREFKVAQDDSVVEMLGAPLKIAYKDGEPTGAALGFAKKCGVDISEISSIDKGRGEVLYFKKEQKGEKASNLLESMVNEFINGLEFGKTMRWGSLGKNFIRPIRGLCIMLGDEIVDAELFGVNSSANSFAHRMVSYDRFDFDFAGDYFCKLDKHGVILYQDERRKIILDQMAKLEKENNFNIEIDEELLEEIVAITEYPTALLGKFDEEFLELPQEVIVNSMKEHQRYFAIYKDGKITNKFIVVSNSYTKDFSEIVAGNEKVLRPRLADGMFFWNNDLKNGLQNEGLKKITFVEGLGSVYSKCERECIIAGHLADEFGIQNKELLNKTVMMAKSDLMTDMVYEFTELQGLMGYYYAKKAGEEEDLCIAIKEQYLPNKEDGEVPSTVFSSIVALSNKLDTLMGLFSLGMVPTGSRDPFALRRAASGIVKICITHNLALDLYSIMLKLQKEYNNLDIDKINEFFNDRLFKIFKKVNPSVIKAVLSSGESDILKISQKIDALNPIVQSDSFKDISTTFKRVANIIKDIDVSKELSIDENLFEEDAEKKLYTSYKNVTSKTYITYDEELEALFALKPNLDSFFENVFVNHENESIKTNRKNLIGLTYQAFRNIADIKEITI